LSLFAHDGRHRIAAPSALEGANPVRRGSRDYFSSLLVTERGHPALPEDSHPFRKPALDLQWVPGSTGLLTGRS